MKKISLFTFISLAFFPLSSVFAVTQSPVGFWKTIDDVTGKPKSILQVSQSESGTLSGQVVKIFPKPGHDQNELCTACAGERYNRRIVGMTIMENLKQNKDHPDEWNNGKILDPLNGKFYNCNIQVIAGGQKLNVRGYIGVPLFGRSQTWLRVDEPKGE